MTTNIRNLMEAADRMNMSPKERWWENEPAEIMSLVYWLKNQLPPTDPIKYKEQWANIEKQLQAKYPRPDNA